MLFTPFATFPLIQLNIPFSCFQPLHSNVFLEHSHPNDTRGLKNKQKMWLYSMKNGFKCGSKTETCNPQHLCIFTTLFLVHHLLFLLCQYLTSFILDTSAGFTDVIWCTFSTLNRGTYKEAVNMSLRRIISICLCPPPSPRSFWCHLTRLVQYLSSRRARDVWKPQASCWPYQNMLFLLVVQK